MSPLAPPPDAHGGRGVRNEGGTQQTDVFGLKGRPWPSYSTKTRLNNSAKLQGLMTIMN